MGHSLNVLRFFICVLLAAFALGPTDARVTPRKMCGLGKECLPRYLCDKSDIVIIDGRNLIDYRSGENGCDWLEKCCSVPNQEHNDDSDNEPEIRLIQRPNSNF